MDAISKWRLSRAQRDLADANAMKGITSRFDDLNISRKRKFNEISCDDKEGDSIFSMETSDEIPSNQMYR